jgi:hypothetical protein
VLQQSEGRRTTQRIDHQIDIRLRPNLPTLNCSLEAAE